MEPLDENPYLIVETTPTKPRNPMRNVEDEDEY